MKGPVESKLRPVTDTLGDGHETVVGLAQQVRRLVHPEARQIRAGRLPDLGSKPPRERRARGACESRKFGHVPSASWLGVHQPERSGKDRITQRPEPARPAWTLLIGPRPEDQGL